MSQWIQAGDRVQVWYSLDQKPFEGEVLWAPGHKCLGADWVIRTDEGVCVIRSFLRIVKL